MLFKRFLKKLILEDISAKLAPAQYGNQKGTATDYLLVALVDRILKHLDQNLNTPTVITTMLDSSAAFDSKVHYLVYWSTLCNNNADCVDKTLRF